MRFCRMALTSAVSQRHQVVAELDGVLVIGHFGGVQAAIDVDDRLRFARQRARLLVADAARKRQAPRDVLIVIELRQVGRGRR